MALRTTSELVEAILVNDYDKKNRPSLKPFIKAANLMTDRVNTCASGKGYSLSTDELLEIEGWLAAWRYTLSDRVYTSRATASASGSFLVPKNPYLEGAIALDPSGCVAALAENRRAAAYWLGKVPDDRLDADDRVT